MAFFTAIGAAIFGAGTFLAGATAVVLQAAVGIGLNLLAKTLSKTDSAKAGTGGVEGTLQAGGDIARSIMLGRRVTAGSLAYANTWGSASKTPNAYFTQVIALSDFPIAGISAVWVNGEPVTIDTGNTSYGTMGFPVVEYAKGTDNHLWIKFYDGTQTVADPFLTGSVSTANRPYDGSRIGEGVAYAIITAQADDELFTGFPTFKFEVQGARLYDVSKDSTNGGAGPHRWTDQSTWGGDGDDLPAVQIYNLLRGLYYDSAWLYGLQTLTAARLPSDDWIQQINKCRAGIAGPAGTETTYLTSLEVSVDTEIGTTIESLLTGCQGRLIESGGIYKVRVGEPGAPVFAFSDGDILSTEEQSFTPFFGLADTVNGVSATYPEPDEAWNTKAAPPLYNAAYQIEDGARRLMTSVEMDMVYRSSQVQRIMKSALAEARRARRETFVLPPSAWILEPGDVVEFTSNRNGFEAKLFRVDGVADHANLDITVDLTEVDPADYDWDQDHDYTPPVFAPLGPVRPPSQPMYGWQVDPAVLTDGDGVPWRPTIQISCAPDQVDVRSVWVQVRLASTGDVVFDSQQTAYAPPYSWVLNANFKGNTNYEARGKFVPYSQRATDWSDWLPVTTPNVNSDDLLVDLAHIKSDVLAVFKDIFSQIDDLRPLIEQLLINTQSDSAVFDTAQRYLKATVGENKASFDEQIAVVADDVSAAVAQTTAISAELSDRFATGLIKFEAAANQTGVDARFSIALRAGMTDDYIESGMFLEIYTVAGIQKSRFSVLADQFTVLNPDSIGTAYLPLVFEAGVLKLQNVKVEWADIVNAVINWAQIQTAVVNNFIATTANIGDLTVTTLKIAYDQVTTSAQFSYVNGGTFLGDIPGSAATLANLNPSPVKIYYSLTFQMDAAATGTNRVQLVNTTDGTILADHAITKSSTGSAATLSAVNQVAFDFRPGAARNQSYKWQGVGGPSIENINLRCVYECMKR